RGDADAAGLLRGFGENFPPTFCALPCGSEQGFFAAGGSERHDGAYPELGGFFDSPFEGVEFHDREKQGDLYCGLMGGNIFEQSEIDAVASDLFDSAQANLLAVT